MKINRISGQHHGRSRAVVHNGLVYAVATDTKGYLITSGHQLWGYFSPNNVRLWMAVKQQDGGSGCSAGIIYLNVGQGRLLDLEPS